MNRPIRRTILLLAVALSAAGCVDDNLTPVPGLPAYEAGLSTAFGCVPDLDGRLDSHELAPLAGVPVSYRVSPAGMARAVDVAGMVNAEGQRVWDWSAAGNDQLARIEAAPVAGRWYAEHFPTGQVVVPFDAAGRIEAVMRHDAQALWLLGLASAVADPPEGRTLLVYDQPVATYRFPIQPGASWTSSAAVHNGLLNGLPYAGQDTYAVRVDGAGHLHLPDLTLTQAWRVRIDATVSPAIGKPVTRRQVSFLFECLGEVARATSLEGEPAEDFTTAAEVRRLGL